MVKEMKLTLGLELLTRGYHIEGSVLKIIERLKNHPSVVAIFENHKDNAPSVKHVSFDEITTETKNVDVKKACQDTDNASKVIKDNSGIFVDLF